METILKLFVKSVIEKNLLFLCAGLRMEYALAALFLSNGDQEVTILKTNLRYCLTSLKKGFSKLRMHQKLCFAADMRDQNLEKVQRVQNLHCIRLC